MATLITRPRILALVCLLLAWVTTSCGTLPGTNTTSFASVSIDNKSDDAIAVATAEVFLGNGFRGGVSQPGRLIFEKETSKATTFAREGIANTLSGAQTIQRACVDIVFVSTHSRRLQCQVVLVTGGSDPFFQDEIPISHLRSSPYQTMLNQVKDKLK
jgi:hypothetical protein